MRAKYFLLLFLMSLLLCGKSQAQCSVSTSANYVVSDSSTLDATGTHVITTAVITGNAAMNINGGCIDALRNSLLQALRTATHTPSLTNKVGTVITYSTGSSVCATCYLTYQNSMDSGAMVPSQPYPQTVTGAVQCSAAGGIFSFNITDFAEVATTKSVRTGPSTFDGIGGWVTPIGQFCSAATYPPDFNPVFADTWSSTASYFIGSAACVRLGPGHAWVCGPGVATPLFGAQSPGNCTRNP